MVTRPAPIPSQRTSRRSKFPKPTRRRRLLVESLEDRSMLAIAYQVPAGTVGNQSFGGALGMDFDCHFHC
jgi:hypothetical protein